MERSPASVGHSISRSAAPEASVIRTRETLPTYALGISASSTFRKWCDEAGLPHCSAHGLRYATAAHLAEHGASAHEIMAITGHRSLAEVERYTRAARKATLADAAMARLKSEQ